MGPDRRRAARPNTPITVLATLALLAAVPAAGAAAETRPSPQSAAAFQTVNHVVAPMSALTNAPAAAPAPASPPDDATVAQARAEAEAAALRVDALRTRYQELTARSVQGARRLADAFAAQARISGAHLADVAALDRAQAVRATSLRATYAEGGRLGLLGSVLSAPTVDDALWRMGTARRIEADVLRGQGRLVDDAARAEARSRLAADAASRADDDLARELAAFQDDVAEADLTLRQAEAELAHLSARARQVTAARDAARRLEQARAAAQSARLAGSGVTALGIPQDYLSTYRAAAPTCPGLDWTLLAAVGQVESGHGRNNGPSSAGAIGPMQFMPATFAHYAVDGDHDGVTDAWDRDDAIFTAAAYLCASGARGGSAAGVRTALFAYNHAQWYVDLVLSAQSAIITAQP